MRAEEAKLARMRRKLADHELKIVRGHVSITERDLHGGVGGVSADDSDDSATLPNSPTGAPALGLRDATCWR